MTDFRQIVQLGELSATPDEKKPADQAGLGCLANSEGLSVVVQQTIRTAFGQSTFLQTIRTAFSQSAFLQAIRAAFSQATFL
jgi:hypothetical protein